MKICYFGIYNATYCRNKNIIKGLAQNEVELIEINDTKSGYGKYFRLTHSFLKKARRADVVIVGFPGQVIVPIAWFLTQLFSQVLVFDLHVSYYDSIIVERKKYSKYSLPAVWFYFLDFISCHLADRVLLDTHIHGDYIVKLLKIRRENIIIVYHGIDDEIFKNPLDTSCRVSEDTFIISFHGYIQILNGMDLVVKAMKILGERKLEAKLWIIGGGTEYPAMQRLSEELKLTNIDFFPPLKPSELVPKISGASIGLGFFGMSAKIDRVIANKIYELMALKIPVLTGYSEATAELFKHKEHIYYCKRGDVCEIADAIVDLQANKTMMDQIAENAYNYVISNLTPKIVGKKFIDQLSSVLIK